MVGFLHPSLSLTSRGGERELEEEDDGESDGEGVKGWIFVRKSRGKNVMNIWRIQVLKNPRERDQVGEIWGK